MPQAGPIWWSNASRTLPFCCDEPDSTVIEVSLGRYRQTTSFSLLRATASTAWKFGHQRCFYVFFLPASMLLCSNCSGIACKFKYTLDWSGWFMMVWFDIFRLSPLGTAFSKSNVYNTEKKKSCPCSHDLMPTREKRAKRACHINVPFQISSHMLSYVHIDYLPDSNRQSNSYTFHMGVSINGGAPLMDGL